MLVRGAGLALSMSRYLIAQIAEKGNLRKLEQRGLLHRLVHPVVTPHVDYSLTPAGNKFAEAVVLLC